jgi:hypothetical protein
VLLSAPLSPSKSRDSQHSNPPNRSPSPASVMDRSQLHGTPPVGPRGLTLQGHRGPPSQYSPGRSLQGSRSATMQAASPASPAVASQDARSNLAVQPVADAGRVRLKKAAVKLVRAPSVMPAASPKPAVPAFVAPPASGPVLAKPQEVERYVSLRIVDVSIVHVQLNLSSNCSLARWQRRD